MKLKNILNSNERKIHRYAHKSIDEIMSRINSQSGSAGQMQLNHNELYSLSSKYVKLYQSLSREKNRSGLSDTHSIITEYALILIGKNPDDPAYHNLIDSSTGPDRNIKSIA